MYSLSISLMFFLFFLVACLYSSVGHAGASGYIALMSILSFAPENIKPYALILNCIVSLIAAIKFIKAGYFEKNIFLIFTISSLPFALIGGFISLNPFYFKMFSGFFLIIAAFLLVLKAYIKPKEFTFVPLPAGFSIFLGAIIGLLSGLIGVGGGIFLSPILILANWTSVKKAAGISALFIFCNSVAALIGQVPQLMKIDSLIFLLAISVVLGGILGSYLGTKKFNNKIIISFLFIVLISAGLKFIFV